MSDSKHTDTVWQGGEAAQTTRLWARKPGGDVILADFSVSRSLRHEEQVANAKRARLCVNFCIGMSDEQIERLMKLGYQAGHWVEGGGNGS
jgi:hypothetical protein